MKKHFGEIHAREVGSATPLFGFPDHGFGRYSDKLEYKDWYKFACS